MIPDELQQQDQDAISWITNWLSQRKSQLANNMQNSAGVMQTNKMNPDYPVFRETPDEDVTNQVLDMQLDNMRSANYSSWQDTFRAYPRKIRNYENKNTLEVYSPSDHIVSYNPKLVTPTTFTHERTHALNAKPQLNTISQILSEDGIDENYNTNSEWTKYLLDPNEIYSRMMEWRQRNDIDPSIEITDEYLENNQDGLKETNLDIFPRKTQLRLLNEVAQNNTRFRDFSQFARRGTKLIPRIKNRRNLN